ncbi:unnamed protein product [Clavelina lepadiformis]|uniref:Uncharacterized protein n=1 Tax=Clavelina lepadiformis TaxID=159417 RepID=A0ABP0GJK6_CLALP
MGDRGTFDSDQKSSPKQYLSTVQKTFDYVASDVLTLQLRQRRMATRDVSNAVTSPSWSLISLKPRLIDRVYYEGFVFVCTDALPKLSSS